MRVAVTGASGFVGSAVVRYLVQRGYHVQAFGRRATWQPGGGVDVPYAPWDIAAGPLLSPPSVDAVVHCAAFVGDWGREAEFERTNVAGTAHVLKSWPDARLVHISSGSVYDPRADHRRPLEEADADPFDRASIRRIRWLGHYGWTKRLAEYVVVSGRPRDAVILRPHAVYGPGDRTLLPRVLRRYRRGRLFVVGNPSSRLSVTHIDNLTSAIELAVSGNVSGVYNVADPDPVPLGTLLEGVLVAIGRRPHVVYLPVTPVWWVAALAELVHSLGDLPRPVVTRFELSHLRGDFVLDTSRAWSEMGWRPPLETMDGVRSLGTPEVGV